MIRPQISHIGLWVQDLDRMLAFYRDTLGLVETDRGRIGPEGAETVFLSGDPDEHHQVALAAGRPADQPYSVINHLSFKLGSLADLRSIAGRIAPQLSEGPFAITHGNSWSVYGRDPEGNMLEFHCDSPWHVQQPVARPFDLSQPDAAIHAETYALLAAEPGFQSRESWREFLSDRLKQKDAQ